MRRANLLRVLLALTLSMTVGEFVEVQKLASEDLRKRFNLPSACEPAVTALATEPAANRVTVAIECRAKPAGAASPATPGQPQQPSRPPGKAPGP